MKKLACALTCILLCASTLIAQTKSIAVTEPVLENSSESNSWISLFVQGQIATNLNNYKDNSGLEVIDRANIDKVKKEQKLSESASYSESDQLTLGKLVSAKYIVAVTIIAKGSGYAFDCKVTETETGKIYGNAYTNANCSAFQMENGYIANEASRQILLGFGVKESKLKDLVMPEEVKGATGSSLTQGTQNVTTQANINLAKGIDAQNRGTTVEAMSYFFVASEYEANNSELNSKLNELISTISSGNMGDSIRGEIALYNLQKNNITEAQAFFKKNPVYQVVYSTELTSDIDFSKTTPVANISYYITLTPSESAVKIINTISEGLKKSDPENEWRLQNWDKDIWGADYWVSVALKNANGDVIASSESRLRGGKPSSSSYFNRTIQNIEDGKVWESKYAMMEDAGLETVTFKNVNPELIIDPLSLEITEITATLGRTAQAIELSKIRIVTFESCIAGAQATAQTRAKKEAMEAQAIAEQEAIEEKAKSQKRLVFGVGLGMSYTTGPNLGVAFELSIPFASRSFARCSIGGGFSEKEKGNSSKVAKATSSSKSSSNVTPMAFSFDYGINFRPSKKIGFFGFAGINNLNEKFGIEAGAGLDFFWFDLGGYEGFPLTATYTFSSTLDGVITNTIIVGGSLYYNGI